MAYPKIRRKFVIKDEHFFAYQDSDLGDSLGRFALLFDGAAESSQVLAKRVSRIGGASGEVIGEMQLSAKQFAGTNGVGLGAFALPDFARGFEQGFDGIAGDENAAVVIGENNVVRLDREIAEAGGAQCVGVPRIET